MTHGTLSTYNNHGCRCEACRAANAAYSREFYAARVKNGLCVRCAEPSEASLCGRCLEKRQWRVTNYARAKAGLPPLTLAEFQAINARFGMVAA